jgi:hypothetical protein
MKLGVKASLFEIYLRKIDFLSVIRLKVRGNVLDTLERDMKAR